MWLVTMSVASHAQKFNVSRKPVSTRICVLCHIKKFTVLDVLN